MSPFTANFAHVLANAFRETAEEEVKISVERNRLAPARRAFVLQGSGPIYLVHMPYLGAASQRQQCILNGELSGVGLKAYTEAKRADPTATYVACTLKGEDLSAIIKRKSLKCTISKLTAKGISAISEEQITNITVLKYRPLSSRYLDPTYPSKMHFYLYGTAREMHIDHVLLRVPNAQLSAGEVVVELLPVEGDRSVFVAGLQGGLIAVADAIPEFLMQPLNANSLRSFFHPGAKLAVSIYHDHNATQSQGPGLCDQLGDPITRGTITLTDHTFADAYMINVGTPIVVPQAPKTSLAIPEATPSSQDHPLFLGYGPGGKREQPSSLETAKIWRNMWNEAVLSSNTESSTSSPWSTPSDTETSDYYFPSLAQLGQFPSFHG